MKIVKICFKKSKFNRKSKISDIVTRTRIQKAKKTRESASDGRIKEYLNDFLWFEDDFTVDDGPVQEVVQPCNYGLSENSSHRYYAIATSAYVV